ncbi:MAG: hypothetical protein WCQ60_03435, partial [bacterium]
DLSQKLLRYLLFFYVTYKFKRVFMDILQYYAKLIGWIFMLAECELQEEKSLKMTVLSKYGE